MLKKIPYHCSVCKQHYRQADIDPQGHRNKHIVWQVRWTGHENKWTLVEVNVCMDCTTDKRVQVLLNQNPYGNRVTSIRRRMSR